MRSATIVRGVIRCGELESEVRSPGKPIGRRGTIENRVRGKISPYHSLKAQLTSCNHFSSRSRSEGRIDTNINITIREWRRKTTSHGLSRHQSLENLFIRRRTTFELVSEAERGLPYIRIEWPTGERDR